MVSWSRPLRRTSSLWPKWAKSTRLWPHSLVILPLWDLPRNVNIRAILIRPLFTVTEMVVQTGLPGAEMPFGGGVVAPFVAEVGAAEVLGSPPRCSPRMPLPQARLQEGPNDYLKVSVGCKSVNLDQINFKTPKQEVPVGERLAFFFLPEWVSVTSDKWVLDVIRHGYALEFSDMLPRFTGIRRTKMPRQKQHNMLLQEVQTLLSKKAIELVPPHKVRDGFYSTLFMVPKNNSEKLRPVINLKPLNQFLLKKSFKIDHLGVVMKLLRKGDWTLSVDLTNAYLHVPILSNHRKFLRFVVGHHCCQFRYLSFGPTTAPRVYAECSSAILEGTGNADHGISGRFSLVSESSRYLCNSRDTTLQVLNRLGFLVNLEKSELLPSRFAKIKELIQSSSAQNQISALMLLRILGVMASTIQVMRFSCTLIPVNSGGGGGGGVLRQGCSGLRCWTKQEAQLHINILEST